MSFYRNRRSTFWFQSIRIKLEWERRTQRTGIELYLVPLLLLYRRHLRMIRMFGIISGCGSVLWMPMLELLSSGLKRTECGFWALDKMYPIYESMLLETLSSFDDVCSEWVE